MTGAVGVEVEVEEHVPPRRRRRVWAWIGGAAGVLALGAGLAGWYLLYAPPTPEPDLAASVASGTLASGGTERTYTTVVPDGLQPGAPLFVALHGSRMDGAGMREATGYELDRLAVERGFAVVYPDGYEQTWHDCRTSTPYAARVDGIDDVAFLEALVSEVTAAHGLDASRVYGVGYSNGAHMAYRMAAESPGTFAGIEMNAANVPTAEGSACTGIALPIPTILVQGTGDPINPYQGGKAGMLGQDLGTVMSAEESAATLAGSFGIAADPSVTVVGGAPGERGAVTLTAYGEAGEAPVLLYTVEGGGHAVPNPVTALPRIMGGSTPHLNAPAVAVEEFLG